MQDPPGAVPAGSLASANRAMLEWHPWSRAGAVLLLTTMVCGAILAATALMLARDEAPATAATTSHSTSRSRGDLPLSPALEVNGRAEFAPVAYASATSAAVTQIPAPALAAYQRAEAVLAAADANCHLAWTLVAAVGHVASAHGTGGGGQMDAGGVVRPKFAGKPLLSASGERLADSDAGAVDGDVRFDRPVGPMQLTPPAWAVVGVDGDADGRRNANDVDDASLAVAVLLCSGRDDLRTLAGRAAGVRRVNRDPAFVDGVLAVADAYRTQARQVGAVSTSPSDTSTEPLAAAPPSAVVTAVATELDEPVRDPATMRASVAWTPSPTPTATPTSTPTPEPSECPPTTGEPTGPTTSTVPSDTPSSTGPATTTSELATTSSPDGPSETTTTCPTEDPTAEVAR